MNICNTVSQPFREIDFSRLIYNKNTSNLVTAVDFIFLFGLLVAVATEGADVQQWDLNDPQFRKIVYWGSAEIGSSALFRLPYTDARTTAIKIAQRFFVLFPFPAITILAALSGHNINKNTLEQLLAFTAAMLLGLGRLAITYGMSRFSVERHQDEQRQLLHHNHPYRFSMDS